MHITGERRIPAPRERVWRSLSDARVLQECVPGSQVDPSSDAGGLTLSGFGGTPVHVQPSIREPFSTLGWKIDPKGAASQLALIQLAEEGVFTRLHYELSLVDGQGEASDTREANLRARIDQALGRFIQGISGPAEIGAGGLANAVQATTDPSAQPNARIGAAPGAAAIGSGLALGSLMNPLVIGGALFLLVLLFMVGLF